MAHKLLHVVAVVPAVKVATVVKDARAVKVHVLDVKVHVLVALMVHAAVVNTPQRQSTSMLKHASGFYC